MCVSRNTWRKRCAWPPWPAGHPWLTWRKGSKRRERAGGSTWHWDSRTARGKGNSIPAEAPPTHPRRKALEERLLSISTQSMNHNTERFLQLILRLPASPFYSWPVSPRRIRDVLRAWVASYHGEKWRRNTRSKTGNCSLLWVSSFSSIFRGL